MTPALPTVGTSVRLFCRTGQRLTLLLDTICLSKCFKAFSTRTESSFIHNTSLLGAAIMQSGFQSDPGMGGTFRRFFSEGRSLCRRFLFSRPGGSPYQPQGPPTDPPHRRPLTGTLPMSPSGLTFFTASIYRRVICSLLTNVHTGVFSSLNLQHNLWRG